eukprot:UC4_evm1s27
MSVAGSNRQIPFATFHYVACSGAQVPWTMAAWNQKQQQSQWGSSTSAVSSSWLSASSDNSGFGGNNAIVKNSSYGFGSGSASVRGAVFGSGSTSVTDAGFGSFSGGNGMANSAEQSGSGFDFGFGTLVASSGNASYKPTFAQPDVSSSSIPSVVSKGKSKSSISQPRAKPLYKAKRNFTGMVNSNSADAASEGPFNITDNTSAMPSAYRNGPRGKNNPHYGKGGKGNQQQQNNRAFSGFSKTFKSTNSLHNTTATAEGSGGTETGTATGGFGSFFARGGDGAGNSDAQRNTALDSVGTSPFGAIFPSNTGASQNQGGFGSVFASSSSGPYISNNTSVTTGFDWGTDSTHQKTGTKFVSKSSNSNSNKSQKNRRINKPITVVVPSRMIGLIKGKAFSHLNLLKQKLGVKLSMKIDQSNREADATIVISVPAESDQNKAETAKKTLEDLISDPDRTRRMFNEAIHGGTNTGNSKRKHHEDDLSTGNRNFTKPEARTSILSRISNVAAEPPAPLQPRNPKRSRNTDSPLILEDDSSSDYEDLLSLVMNDDAEKLKIALTRPQDANSAMQVPALLVAAAEHDKSNAASAILGHMQSVDDIIGEYGTALHYAVYFGSVETTKLLLSQGARSDLKNASGDTQIDTFKQAVREDVIESEENINIISNLLGESPSSPLEKQPPEIESQKEVTFQHNFSLDPAAPPFMPTESRDNPSAISNKKSNSGSIQLNTPFTRKLHSDSASSSIVNSNDLKSDHAGSSNKKKQRDKSQRDILVKVPQNDSEYAKSTANSRLGRFQGSTVASFTKLNGKPVIDRAYLKHLKVEWSEAMALRKEQIKINPEAKVRGTCTFMCPEYERVDRICEGKTHYYERNPPGLPSSNDSPNEYILIKTFGFSCRAAADKAYVSMLVRTLPALHASVTYLCSKIVDGFGKDKWTDDRLYIFLNDRFKAVTSDLNLQINNEEFMNARTALVFEICLRFRIIFQYHLNCLAYQSALTAQKRGKSAPEVKLAAESIKENMWLNREQRNKTIGSLIRLYKDLKHNGQEQSCGMAGTYAYKILCSIGDEGCLQNIPNEIREDPAVKTAIRAVQAFSSNNYCRYFKIYEDLATGKILGSDPMNISVAYCMACLMHQNTVKNTPGNASDLQRIRSQNAGYLGMNCVRVKSLNIIYRAYSKQSTIPVLQNLLKFETAQATRDFLKDLGHKCNDDDLVMLSKDSSIPNNPISLMVYGGTSGPYHLIERCQHNSGLTLGDLIKGGSNSVYIEPRAETPPEIPLVISGKEPITVNYEWGETALVDPLPVTRQIESEVKSSASLRETPNFKIAESKFKSRTLENPSLNTEHKLLDQVEKMKKEIEELKQENESLKHSKIKEVKQLDSEIRFEKNKGTVLQKENARLKQNMQKINTNGSKEIEELEKTKKSLEGKLKEEKATSLKKQNLIMDRYEIKLKQIDQKLIAKTEELGAKVGETYELKRKIEEFQIDFEKKKSRKYISNGSPLVSWLPKGENTTSNDMQNIRTYLNNQSKIKTRIMQPIDIINIIDHEVNSTKQSYNRHKLSRAYFWKLVILCPGTEFMCHPLVLWIQRKMSISKSSNGTILINSQESNGKVCINIVNDASSISQRKTATKGMSAAIILFCEDIEGSPDYDKLKYRLVSFFGEHNTHCPVIIFSTFDDENILAKIRGLASHAAPHARSCHVIPLLCNWSMWPDMNAEGILSNSISKLFNLTRWNDHNFAEQMHIADIVKKAFDYVCNTNTCSTLEENISTHHKFSQCLSSVINSLKELGEMTSAKVVEKGIDDVMNLIYDYFGANDTETSSILIWQAL